MKVDVAIAGGGPAASAAAFALRRRGLSCAIVERGDGSGEKVGESLAPAAKPLLDALGLDLARDGHLPCHGHRSVWGSDRPVEMPFDLSPYGNGWHLDRRKFEERLAELADCPRLMNTRVMDVECGGHAAAVRAAAWPPHSIWRITTDRETIVSHFLIDATGRRAAIARRLGARIVRDDTLGPKADTYTEIQAAADGWWYRAPIPGGAIAMFVSDVRKYDTLTLDASSFRLDRVAGPGWLAIGDAACALDPLSSHGLGNALFTGMRAAEAIATGNIAEYENAVDTMWRTYVSRRRELYAAERRWPSSPFWSRRYTAPS